jgi:6-carboxyhexanoate--CoA ligase
MRASKTACGNELREIHISGAEGLYDVADLAAAGAKYIKRAIGHSRGMPENIVITLEKVKTRPVIAPLLRVSTENCENPNAAWDTVRHYTSRLGVSGPALALAEKILFSKNSLRGAALISTETEQRLDPDTEKGVRVSRLGICKTSASKLEKELATLNINTPTVKEALILASKVASCKDIVAEICISDDPDYTTGYVASRSLGYVRIPNIKKRGSMHGGRIFFLKPHADIRKVIQYLEKKAVIVKEKEV